MLNINFNISILLLIIITWIWYIYFNHPDYEICEYDDIKDRCKTGDIILFHGLDNANPIIIGSYYSHIGIVYIDPEDPQKTPYILEAFNPSRMPLYSEKCKSGIAIVPLEARLTSYRGYCFYKELANPIKDKKLLLNFKQFVNFCKKNMYYDENVLSCALAKILFNENLRLGTNCAELVYLSLIKLELLNKNYFYENNKHHLIFLVKLQKLEKGNSYKEPVYILANYFKDPI
jgi:hypothetical protein